MIGLGGGGIHAPPHDCRDHAAIRYAMILLLA